MINVQNISSKLASLPDQALKQYAEMHKEDPYVFSLALSESNRRKQLRMQTQQPEQQPKVVDQELADMDVRKALPEDLGIAKLPINMNMAGGGIVAFNDGGMSHYARGGNAGEGFSSNEDSDAFKFALNNTLTLEGGLNKDDKVGGLTKYGISQKAYPKLDIAKLTPADAKAIYKRDYWDKIGGDEIAARDPKLAALMFDTAVQHGVSGAKDMLSQSGDDPAKLLQVRLDKLRSLVQDNPEKYGSQAKGWSNRIAKLAYTLAPGSTAQAATPVEAPKESSWRDLLPNFGGDKVSDQSLSDLVAGKPAPAQDKSFLDSARENADFIMNPPKKSGVAYDPKTFRNPESQAIQPLYPELAVLGAPGRMAAIAKRVLDTKPAASQDTTAGLSAIAPKPATQESPLLIKRDLSAAEKERMNMSPRGPSYPVGEEASTMNFLARQRLARQGATKGAAQVEETSAASTPAAVRNSPSVAQNIQTKMLPPSVESATAAAPEETFNPDYQPDTSRGYPAPASPAVDDRTKRDPANYKPEEKKQIVAAAKEALPKTEDTDGWSKNDWLQFGLAMMAGQSPHALSNIGAAGLAVLSNKAEKVKEQNKLDLYKSVHGEKPGQSIQIAERLMAADPKLSFEDALSKATALTGGATKDDLASIKADQQKTALFKVWSDAKEKIDKGLIGLSARGANATPQAKKAYADAVAELGPNPMGDVVKTPTAPSAASALGWGQATKQ